MSKYYPFTSDSVLAEPEGEVLFEVTVTSVIGKVRAGGHLNPRVAAFILIAEAGITGEYSFPAEDGGVEVVTVKQFGPDEQRLP